MADKQLAKKGKSGVDNTFRRTWDKEDFAEKAAKREKEVHTDRNVSQRQTATNRLRLVCSALNPVCRRKMLKRVH